MQMTIVNILVLLITALLCPQVLALPQHNPVPGGIALITLPPDSDTRTARYNNRKLSIFNHGKDKIALIGIALSTKPGQHRATVQIDNREHSLTFTVVEKSYQEQHLTITNKRKVNPHKMDMTRISSERERKNRARKYYSNTTPQINFEWPVEGRISSIFGLRRFFNEQPRRPHTGLDIAAPEGTPIRATADGRVIETGDFFFSGQLVYIDHGMGLNSLYAHMSRVDVKKGQMVKQGEIIGAVGQTGRVTGAHLHFSVMANQSLIDPLLMLPPADTAHINK